MSTFQKILIALGIIIVIAIIVVMILISQIKDEGTDTEETNSLYEQQIIYENDESLQPVQNKSEYFSVKYIINSYFANLEGVNGDQRIMYEVTDPQELASIKKEQFNQSYKRIKDIIDDSTAIKNYQTEEAVKQEGAKFKSYSPIIKKMLISETSASINVFIVDLKVGDVETKIAVKTDSQNMTYTIIPCSFVEKYAYDNNTLLSKISPDDIQKNENNTFNYTAITNEYMARMYLASYRENATTDVEGAYNSLDKEYATKRFGTFENYKAYVNKNIDKIKNIQIAKYKYTEGDDYNQYICIDSEGNYYIFREKELMDYTLLLDTYTIDLPEYIEKYNKATQQQKVAYNIDKFVKAVNDENYTLAYSFLSQGFKNNYFKQQQTFEEYVKKNFVGRSEITYVSYKTEGNLFTYSVIFKNPDDIADSIQKTFIVSLKDGTDFEMSFNVN